MTPTPLPPPGVNIAAGNWTAVTDCRYYTADQMQAYATQARADLEAEVARLREALKTIAEDVTVHSLAKAKLIARTALKEQP